MSFTPMLFNRSKMRKPLSKPPSRPRNSSFFIERPSMLMRMPMFGNFFASAMTLSSNHPEVEMTTRGDFLNATRTISSKSSRTNGSPPVMLMNLTFGSTSISAGVISLSFCVGFCHILHILHRIGQR